MEKLIEDYIRLKQKEAIKEHKDKNNSNKLLELFLSLILVTGFVYLAHENIKLNKPAIVNLK
jgi:hypothetical protein